MGCCQSLISAEHSEIAAESVQKSYFSYAYGSGNTFISYNALTNQSQIHKYDSLDFYGYYTIQVENDLYGFRNGKESNFVKYTDLDGKSSDRVRIVGRAKPLIARAGPSLANVAQICIFVSGGRDPSNKSETFTSCDVYNVLNDSWQSAPSMGTPRRNHGCCVVSHTIYAFCGYNRKDKYLATIERLDAGAYLSGENTTW